MALAIRRAVTLTAAAVLASGALVACGANDADEPDTGSGDGSDGGGAKIALLLPESQTTRYESFDKPIFEAKVAELCADCEVVYFNADQDPTQQRQQVDTAINQDVDVMVLDPVDSEAAVAMAEDAQAADIPVIAYDRFIEGADYYMSFDNERVGQLQAESLVEATGDTGSIFILNGAPTDPNAAQFKAGMHSVIDESGLTVIDEYDNPDWSPENAESYMSDRLSSTDPADIAGVYAANDGQAGGVVAALTKAGVADADLPPITGQDAELAAIQRIVAGQQYMTIFKSYFIEAEKAAEVAVQLANGEEVTGTTDFEGSAAFIFDPVVVTKENVKADIVDTGLYSVEDICTADYADDCADAGLE